MAIPENKIFLKPHGIGPDLCLIMVNKAVAAMLVSMVTLGKHRESTVPADGQGQEGVYHMRLTSSSLCVFCRMRHLSNAFDRCEKVLFLLKQPRRKSNGKHLLGF